MIYRNKLICPQAPWAQDITYPVMMPVLCHSTQTYPKRGDNQYKSLRSNPLGDEHLIFWGVAWRNFKMNDFSWTLVEINILS